MRLKKGSKTPFLTEISELRPSPRPQGRTFWEASNPQVAPLSLPSLNDPGKGAFFILGSVVINSKTFFKWVRFMKTVKLKAELKSRGFEVIILTFDDKDLNILRLFQKNFDRFRTAHIFEKGIPSIKKINWEVEGIQFTFSDFNYHDICELLHLARPIFLSKEPASFEKTCAIFGKRGKGSRLTSHILFIRSLYQKGEYLPLFQITIGSVALFDETTLQAWLNGVEYHQDKEKRKLIKQLEDSLNEETLKGIFVSQLSGRIKATFMLAHLVNMVLKKDKI